MSCAPTTKPVFVIVALLADEIFLIDLVLIFRTEVMSAFGTKQTSQVAQSTSAFGGKADIRSAGRDVR
jgi:hypothetical protein